MVRKLRVAFGNVIGGSMASSHTRRIAALPLGLVALALASPPGWSQLEEVVVTARKQEERLQDVPISVSAFTSEQLTERGARDMFDVTRFTPGFSFEKVNRYGVQGGVSRPVIRGMSNILGEGNAQVFVDGIPYSDSILSFPIVDRIRAASPGIEIVVAALPHLQAFLKGVEGLADVFTYDELAGDCGGPCSCDGPACQGRAVARRGNNACCGGDQCARPGDRQESANEFDVVVGVV